MKNSVIEQTQTPATTPQTPPALGTFWTAGTLRVHVSVLYDKIEANGQRRTEVRYTDDSGVWVNVTVYDDDFVGVYGSSARDDRFSVLFEKGPQMSASYLTMGARRALSNARYYAAVHPDHLIAPSAAAKGVAR